MIIETAKMEARLKKEAMGDEEPEREIQRQMSVEMDADTFFEHFAPNIANIQQAEDVQRKLEAAEAEKIWAEFKATRTTHKPKQTTLCN